MLYKNCHYKYKDRICELIDFLPTTDGEDSNVKIRYTNGKESICLASELYEIPLTESILQSCYKSKTYVRDGNWDIIWHLGGTNNVTVGEKQGKYYVMPYESIETVTKVLPFELVQSHCVNGGVEQRQLTYFSELLEIYPELANNVRMMRF